jgi:hypothetical protein
MSARISRERRSDKQASDEADRRFALLVAMMTTDQRHGERLRARSSRAEGREPSMAFAPPAAGQGEGRRPRVQWQKLAFLLFAGCFVAAILFIVAASFIRI